MPDEIGKAVITVGADARKFDKELHNEVNKSSHSAGSSGGKRFGGGFGSSLTGAAGGIGSAFSKGLLGVIAVGVGGITAVVTEGLKESIVAQNINVQFAAGIKSTGNIAHLSVAGMDELAGSVAEYSGQSWKSIAATEKILQTFPMVKNLKMDKIFDETTRSAADMAAKLGGDATKYAKMLGKALGDPTKGMTALTRAGVVFTAEQKKMVKTMVAHGNILGAQKIILHELTNEFGGAAKAAGGTLTGSIKRAHVAFGELSKGVMAGVLPVITPLIQRAATAMSSPGFQKGFQQFFAGASQVIGWILTTVLPVLWKFGQAFVFPLLAKVINFFRQDLIPGVRALAAAFVAGGDDVTSSGFAGVMERIGLAARVVFDWIKSTGLPWLKKFTSSFAIPAAKVLAAWIVSTYVPAVAKIGVALFNVIKFFVQHQNAAKALAAVVAAVLVAMGVAWTVQAALAVKKSVMTAWQWVVQSMAANTSAGLQKKSVAQIVFGWAVMGAKAVANGIKIAAVWIWGFVQPALLAVGSMAVTVASVVGGWLLIAATAVASAVVIAAQWLIAFWPIALIVVAVGVLAFVIWKNFDKIKKWIGGAWLWVKDVTTKTWNSITNWLSGVWAKITGGVSKAWNAIISWLTTTGVQILKVITLPWRLAVAVLIGIISIIVGAVWPPIKGFIDRVVAGFVRLWERAVAIFTTIKNFVVGIWNTVVGFVSPIVAKLVAEVVGRFNYAKAMVTLIFLTVRNFVVGVWNSISSAVHGAVVAVWAIVVSRFDLVRAFVVAIFTTVKNWVTSTWNSIFAAVSGVAGQIWLSVSTRFNSIKDAIGGALASARKAAGDFISGVLKAITDRISGVKQMGTDLVTGLINGIKSMGTTLMNAVKKFIKDHVPAVAQKLLGLSSPSKLFHDFGKNTVLGFVQGVQAHQSKVGAAVSKMLTPLAGAGLKTSLAVSGGLASPPAIGGVASLGGGGSGAITADQMQQMIAAVLAAAKPNNTFQQTFNEKVNPQILSKQIAWSLR